MAEKVLSSRRKLSARQKKEEHWAYLFLLPLLFVFIVFITIPLVMAFYICFTDYNMAGDMNFVGWENFESVFSNFRTSYFFKSFLNAGLYVLMYVPIVVISGVVVAAFFNSKLRGTTFFKIIYYMPAITSAIASGYVWSWLMNPSYGLFNQLLNAIGLPGIEWLHSSKTALFCIVIVTSWGALGGNMLIFLAALKGIPESYYEAAQLDGAGALRQFWSISLPLIAPTIYFIFTTSMIGAFQLFDQVLVLTNGGPDGSTMTPVFFIHWNAFVEFNGGIASAMSVVLFFVIMIITFVTQRFMREDRT